MTRKLWLGAEALAVALVVGLLALLVWRVVTDNKESVAAALDKGKHPAAPAFDLRRLDGDGSVDLASLRGRKPIVHGESLTAYHQVRFCQEAARTVAGWVLPGASVWNGTGGSCR